MTRRPSDVFATLPPYVSRDSDCRIAAAFGSDEKWQLRVIIDRIIELITAVCPMEFARRESSAHERANHLEIFF